MINRSKLGQSVFVEEILMSKFTSYSSFSLSVGSPLLVTDFSKQIDIQWPNHIVDRYVQSFPLQCRISHREFTLQYMILCLPGKVRCLALCAFSFNLPFSIFPSISPYFHKRVFVIEQLRLGARNIQFFHRSTRIINCEPLIDLPTPSTLDLIHIRSGCLSFAFQHKFFHKISSNNDKVWNNSSIRFPFSIPQPQILLLSPKIQISLEKQIPSRTTHSTVRVQCGVSCNDEFSDIFLKASIVVQLGTSAQRPYWQSPWWSVFGTVYTVPWCIASRRMWECSVGLDIEKWHIHLEWTMRRGTGWYHSE